LSLDEAIFAHGGNIVDQGGGCEVLGPLKEFIVHIFEDIDGRDSLFIESSNTDCTSYIEEFIFMVSVYLLYYLLVPVRLKGRLLHLTSHLLLQRLLYREVTLTHQLLFLVFRSV
jgi:hypothetical protein